MAYQDPDSEDELFANPVSPPTKKVKIVMRRNPPREAAAEPAYAGLSLPSEDEVLEEAFLPLTAQERETWTGWTEVESEPVSTVRGYRRSSTDTPTQSYFNIILQELGIQHAKMQEVFGNDEYSFGILPYDAPPWLLRHPSPTHLALTRPSTGSLSTASSSSTVLGKTTRTKKPE